MDSIKIGSKLICIDAGDKRWCVQHGIIPLKEGKIYTLRGTEIGGKGEGYLLAEIHNRYIILDNPGIEPSYAKHRFIPLSEIDELAESTTNLMYATDQR